METNNKDQLEGAVPSPLPQPGQTHNVLTVIGDRAFLRLQEGDEKNGKVTLTPIGLPGPIVSKAMRLTSPRNPRILAGFCLACGLP